MRYQGDVESSFGYLRSNGLDWKHPEIPETPGRDSEASQMGPLAGIAATGDGSNASNQDVIFSHVEAHQYTAHGLEFLLVGKM